MTERTKTILTLAAWLAGPAFWVVVVLLIVGCVREQWPEREPDIHLDDGRPCWYTDATDKLICRQDAPKNTL